MIAVSTGTAVGINALLSRALGARDPERAEKVALNGVFLAALSFIAFILIGILVSPVFFRSQTDVEEIVDSGITYLTICSCVSFGLFFGITFERLLQSTGRTLYTMPKPSIMISVVGVLFIIIVPLSNSADCFRASHHGTDEVRALRNAGPCDDSVLICGVDNFDKLLRLEGGAADEPAVNIRLS